MELQEKQHVHRVTIIGCGFAVHVGYSMILFTEAVLCNTSY